MPRFQAAVELIRALICLISEVLRRLFVAMMCFVFFVIDVVAVASRAAFLQVIRLYCYALDLLFCNIRWCNVMVAQLVEIRGLGFCWVR